MAVEQKRGCGYRKAGGLYLVGDLSGAIPVEFLPTCVSYPQTRSAQWADPKVLLASVPATEAKSYRERERALLMWVGSTHYTTASFMEEAVRMGVSKRISAIPDDAKPGDPVALAHPQAMPTSERDADREGWLLPVIRTDHFKKDGSSCWDCRDVPAATALANMMAGVGSRLAWTERREQKLKAMPDLARRILANEATLESAEAELPKFRRLPSHNPEHVAGIFSLFILTRVELVLPASCAADMEIQRRCADRSVTIVSVPDGDADHVRPGWKLPSWLRDDEPELPGVTSGDAQGVAEEA